MAIYSTFLGATTFTGEDAKAFNHFMKHGRSNLAAVAAARNGIRMIREFEINRTLEFVLTASDSSQP